MTESPQTRARLGVLYGLAAYGWWGFAVVYFKAVAHVAPLQVLAHRIVWSVVLLAALLAMRKRVGDVVAAWRTPRVRWTLTITTALVSTNWFTFIWAVTNDRVVEASLGYFINPLVNVLLGFVFLRERLRPVQWLCVGLAAAGVIAKTVAVGSVPIVALTLAFSFGFYGLLRKTAAVESLAGLAVETSIVGPIALGYLLWLGGDGSFGAIGIGTDLLLIFGGVVTALPLLWFANAARRLDLATVGFLQYLAPSFQLALGVLVYGEAFGADDGLSFGLIWTGLALYSVDALRRR